MIYLLTTNRPEWAEFAYKQFLKTEGCRLVVLDNYKYETDFWDRVDCEYHHIPDKKNLSQMFNYYADLYKGDEDLFYMDDDIEISKNSLPVMEEAFGQGYDCVQNCRVTVTNGKKSGIWHRRSRNIGACWIAKNNLWTQSRFNGDVEDGVYLFFMNLWDFNCRFLHRPDLANYMIHDTNIVLRKKMFKFDRERVELI